MAKNIVIYTTPTCPYCQQAKAFFKAKGVTYTEKNVAEDQAAAQEMIDKSGQMGVPVIDVDGKMVVGFDRAELEKLIA